ncbi:MAG: autotransporter outer membrane beta-barrel domain-containing protein [Pseudomonadota bacterium]
MNRELATFIALAAASNVALASDWYLEPVVSYTAEASDNRRLSLDPEGDTFGNLVETAARFGTESQRIRFYVTPSAVFRKYDDTGESLNTDDLFLESSLRATGIRSVFDLGVNYQYESTLTSELTSAEPENPDLEDEFDDGTGFAEISLRRERLNLRPKWTRELSERTRMVLAGRYTRVDYNEVAGTTRTNFDSAGVSAGINFRANQRLRWVFTLGASEYEADSTQNTTENLTAEAGFLYNISEKVDARFEIGIQQSEAEFLDDGQLVSEDSTDTVYRLALNRTLERTRLVLDLSRKVSPSGAGFQTTRDQLLVSAERDVSDRFVATVRARYFDSESSDVGETFRDRDYLRTELELNWQVSRHVSLGLLYQYSQQERSGGDDLFARSNTALLTVSYRPQRIRLGR